MKFLQSINLYKKVKRELVAEISDSSWAGAVLSILTTLLVVWLIYSELASFLQVTTVSRLVVEQNQKAADTLQMVFNVDFPKLNCEYVKIQATNFMGTRAAGLATKVSLYHLGRDGTLLAKHASPKESVKHEDGGTAAAANLTLETPPLSAGNFDYTLRTHPAGLFVAFCVPSNRHCQALEPVWEKVAAAMKEAFKEPRRAFAMARVNCEEDEAQPVCAVQEIDAYPTIAVFRLDDKGAPQKETYHGSRSVAALTNWARVIVEQSKSRAPKSRMVDVDQDGALDSHEGAGCRVGGVVQVQMSPGILHFQAVSPGQTFDLGRLDMSHTVAHLSFGHTLTRQEMALLPAELAQATSPLSGRAFGSGKDEGPVTHEHSVKVVRHRVQVGPRWTIRGHAYVAHSAEVTPPAEEAPSVRISYDTLPFTLQIDQDRKTLPAFLTAVCGIVGGVLALAGLLAGILHRVSAVLGGGGGGGGGGGAGRIPT